MRRFGKYRTRRGKPVKPLPETFIMAVWQKGRTKRGKASILGYLPKKISKCARMWAGQLVAKKDARQFDSQVEALTYLLNGPVISGHTFIHGITPTKP